MMPSITTAVPAGPIADGCIGPPWNFDGSLWGCGNGTYAPSDYWTVCCDGDIVDVKANIWSASHLNMTMEDLICCRHIGKLEGGIHPLPTGPPWTCDEGAAGTPLASLAATNTKNAGAFVATYASANYEFGPSPTDFIWTETPQCLWVNTKLSHAMSQVTVDAASIVPLSTTTFIGRDDGNAVTAHTVTTPFFALTSSTMTVQSSEISDAESSITGADSRSSWTRTEPAPSTSKSGSSAGSRAAGTFLHAIYLPLFSLSLFGGLLW